MKLGLFEEIEINNFLTWDFLSTFGGSIVAVVALTQVIKKYINIDPKYIALALSFIIMLVNQISILQDFRLESFVISIFNALIVTGMSIGIFETVIKGFQRRFMETPDSKEAQ